MVVRRVPERTAAGLRSGDELHALAKWIAIRLRWPELADADDTEGDLLIALEAQANGRLEQLPLAERKIKRLRAEHGKWFLGTPGLSRRSTSRSSAVASPA